MIKVFTFLAVGIITLITTVSFANKSGFQAILSSQASGGNELTHGPIFGAVTDTTATVWIRLEKVASKKYTVKTSSKVSDLKNLGLTPDSRLLDLPIPGPDHTYKIVIDNLKPNTQYHVNIYSNDASLLSSPASFKTFATPGTSVDFKFAVLTDFGTLWSSQDPVSYKVGTFKALAAEKPRADFVFLGGDFWHENLGDDFPKPKDFRQKNREFFKNMYSLNSPLGDYNDFVKHILSDYALIHHFDDHDGGINNMNKLFDKKAITLEVLKDFFPTYPMTPHGDWQKFSYGQVDFFVLDVRSQRDVNEDPDGETKSMLDGNNLETDNQLSWFLDGLKNSAATWKIVFTGVPFNPTGMKNDSWAGFKTERTKIVKFIKENNINGVAFISGDIHGGAIDNGTNSSFPEMVVPSPNIEKCFTTGNPGTWSNGIYGSFSKGPKDPPCLGYGIVRVLTNPDRLVMRIKDSSGNQKLLLRHYLNPTDAVKYGGLNLED